MQTVSIDLMKIYPCLNLSESCHQTFVLSMEQLLDCVLPQDILALQDSPDLFLSELLTRLPLVTSTRLEEGTCAFGVTLLTVAEYAHGIGRHLSDVLSRKLYPGKLVDIVGAKSLSFYFYPHVRKEFALLERWIIAPHEEVSLAQQRLACFHEELRLTLLSIIKARQFLSLRSQALSEQPLLTEIQHLSIFEEMQQIIQRLTAEKTMGEIRHSLIFAHTRRPKIFDRGIFEELQSAFSLYGEKFLGTRNSRYVSRLICTHYYFQKKLDFLHKQDPLQQHLLLRFFPTKEQLGILVLMNPLKENEVFKKQHLLEALSRCLSDVKEIDDSFLIDASNPSLLFFYLEIENPCLPPKELQRLRTRLPLEIKRSVQRTANPLFMLRNEEDQMRYLIALTREIRHAKDIPQVVLFFEEQREDSLLFSIILVRVLKKASLPLKQLLAAFPLKTTLREHKTIGFVGKCPKEAVIFQAALPKLEYLRKDHSLDLPKARQRLLLHLNEQLQHVRDYNGGLLSKQLESLEKLKGLLGPLAEENAFALENYFFSIEPLASQITLDGAQLKEGFHLLLHLLETVASHQLGTTTSGCIASTTKEKQQLQAFLEATRETYPDISHSLAQYHDLFCCILFLPPKDREARKLLCTFLNTG